MKRDLAAGIAIIVGAVVAGATAIALTPDPQTQTIYRDRHVVNTVTAPPVTLPPVVETRTVYVERADRSDRPKAQPKASGGFTPLQLKIRWCESRDNYKAQNSRSSASGAWQFIDGTWRSVTGLPGSAKDYDKATQDAAFRKLFAASGTRPWAASRGCWG
jgi:hypothetical protein